MGIYLRNQTAGSDYFSLPVEGISCIYPVMTVVRGKIIYIRSDAASDLGMQPVGTQLRYLWESR